MPRKRMTINNALFEKPFPSALRNLMKERNTTQQELAEALGKTRQSISYYCDGSSSPDWETIANIAKFYSVSADWLLGLSDVPSQNLTVQEIHRMTGLSEENATLLMNHGPYGNEKIPALVNGYEKLINDLICYASTHHATKTYSRFLASSSITNPPSPKPLDGNEGAIILYKVVADVISGIPEEGVDYAKGYVPVPPDDYSRILLDEFLHGLKVYLRSLYFDSDNGDIDDGND